MPRRHAEHDGSRPGAARETLARVPADPSVPFALGFLVLALSCLVAAGSADAEPASPDLIDDAVEAPALLSPDGPRNLDELLAVPPVRDTRTAAERTDASLAEAVLRGSGGSTTKVSGFRKRSTDLFRAERPVEVGEQEMLLRLRLRAKSRETMSVELRF